MKFLHELVSAEAHTVRFCIARINQQSNGPANQSENETYFQSVVCTRTILNYNN